MSDPSSQTAAAASPVPAVVSARPSSPLVRVSAWPSSGASQPAPAVATPASSSTSTSTSTSYPCVRNLLLGSLIGGAGGLAVGTLQRRPALPFGLMGASLLATSAAMRCGLSLAHDRGMVDLDARYFDGISLCAAGATVPLNPVLKAALLNQPLSAAHKIVLKQTSLVGMLLGGMAFAAAQYANQETNDMRDK